MTVNSQHNDENKTKQKKQLLTGSMTVLCTEYHGIYFMVATQFSLLKEYHITFYFYNCLYQLGC